MSGPCKHAVADVGGNPRLVVCRGAGCAASWSYRVAWMQAAVDAHAGRPVKLSAALDDWHCVPVEPLTGFGEALRLVDRRPPR